MLAQIKKRYEILAQVKALGSTMACFVIPGLDLPISINSAFKSWITWVSDTNYNMIAGNAVSGYSFQGQDPHNHLVNLLTSTNHQSPGYNSIFAEHIADYQSIIGPFSLSLRQKPDFTTPMDQIIALYQMNVGNPYLEWLTFNFSRYLLATSARGTLLVNLQGKWGDGWTNAWSAGACSLLRIKQYL